MKLISQGLTAKLFPILVFVIPYALNYGFVVDHFYRCQAYLFDSGLLAGLMWRNGWVLLKPLVAGTESFLQTHTVFIYWLPSVLSEFMPINMVQTFALFQGVVLGLAAIAIYIFLIRKFQWRQWQAAIAGIIFAFNGITQAMLGYPHTEIAGSVLLIVFLLLWTNRRYYGAIAPFLLCLMVREDLGFHIVAILGLVLLVYLGENGQFWRKPHGRWTLGFCAIAMLYSCVALWVQNHFFPGGDDAISRVYLGDPAYAHITWTFLRERFHIYLTTKQYLYLPAIATLILSLYPVFHPSLLIGFLAYVPWFLLHVFALSDQAGLLTGYYAFPFVVSLAWPLVWPWLRQSEAYPGLKQWAIATFTTGLALSIIGGWLSPTAGTVDLSHLSHHANVRAFNQFTTAVEAQDNFSDVVVDESVATLLPHNFQPSQWLGHPVPIASPSTLLYCEPSLQPDQVAAVARSQAFTQQFQIQGTPLRMQTNRDLDQFNSQFQTILEPIE